MKDPDYSPKYARRSEPAPLSKRRFTSTMDEGNPKEPDVLSIMRNEEGYRMYVLTGSPGAFPDNGQGPEITRIEKNIYCAFNRQYYNNLVRVTKKRLEAEGEVATVVRCRRIAKHKLIEIALKATEEYLGY